MTRPSDYVFRFLRHKPCSKFALMKNVSDILEQSSAPGESTGV